MEEGPAHEKRVAFCRANACRPGPAGGMHELQDIDRCSPVESAASDSPQERETLHHLLYKRNSSLIICRPTLVVYFGRSPSGTARQSRDTAFSRTAHLTSEITDHTHTPAPSSSVAPVIHVLSERRELFIQSQGETDAMSRFAFELFVGHHALLNHHQEVVVGRRESLEYSMNLSLRVNKVVVAHANTDVG